MYIRTQYVLAVGVSGRCEWSNLKIRKHCGKLEDGTKLQWIYYKDYIEKFDGSTLSYLEMGA